MKFQKLSLGLGQVLQENFVRHGKHVSGFRVVQFPGTVPVPDPEHRIRAFGSVRASDPVEGRIGGPRFHSVPRVQVRIRALLQDYNFVTTFQLYLLEAVLPLT